MSALACAVAGVAVPRAVRRALAALVATCLGALTAPPLDAQARLLRPRDIDALPSKPADARVGYGPDSLHYGELRLPPGAGPFPVAIVIHGGCWVTRFAAAQNSAALADALRDAGVATWNVEYRRTDSGGGWPGTFHDIAAAAAYLRVLAQSHPLDTARVVAIGHSAGAHLAMWLAGAARIPAGSPIAVRDPLALRAAISLGGIGDLREFRERQSRTCGSAVVDALVGGTPEAVPERYAAASPVELLPFATPMIGIVGDRDGILPAASRAAWLETVRARGGTAELIVVDSLGHHDVMSPQTAAWPRIRDAVLRALDRRR